MNKKKKSKLNPYAHELPYRGRPLESKSGRKMGKRIEFRVTKEGKKKIKDSATKLEMPTSKFLRFSAELIGSKNKKFLLKHARKLGYLCAIIIGGVTYIFSREYIKHNPPQTKVIIMGGSISPEVLLLLILSFTFIVGVILGAILHSVSHSKEKQQG